MDRRKLLGQMFLGSTALAATGTLGYEDKILAAYQGEEQTSTPDGLAGATRKNTNWAKLEDLKEKPPKGKIGKLRISRMILGGNLVLGFAHARDLIYVSDLVRAYHTKEKIFATLKMAEACGINTFLMNPSLCDMITEYWEKADGTIQFMTNCSGKTEKELLGNMQKSIDHGASSCLVQGEVADRLVQEKQFDQIAKSLELARKNGLPAGIAAHRLETLQACVAKGLIPDFWMKTFHHLNYWSARKGGPEQDNVFCREPEETIAFMDSRAEPFIAFKVLAAGAIHPNEGFRYAFESGADFLCVGMYDFQIVDDVNILSEVLKGNLNRKRQWQG
jgi:hypothetical protein